MTMTFKILLTRYLIVLFIRKHKVTMNNKNMANFENDKNVTCVMSDNTNIDIIYTNIIKMT